MSQIDPTAAAYRPVAGSRNKQGKRREKEKKK